MSDPTRPVRRPWADRWLLEAARAAGHLAANQIGPAECAYDALRAAGMSAEELAALVTHVSGADVADLRGVGKDQKPLLAAPLAERFDVVPVRLAERTLVVATPHPLRENLERDLAFAAARAVSVAFAPPPAVIAARARVYGEGAHDQPRITWGPMPTAAGGQQSLPRGAAADVLERIVADAIDQHASDIHLEPDVDRLLVRFRLDGALHDVSHVPADLAPLVMSRLKVSAGLDIANRLRPQDGRASVMAGERQIDLRVSTLPLGEKREKAVIRILDTTATTLDFGALGFDAADERLLRSLFAASEGMVLVTGPTGSGKTTTLYTALASLQSRKTNIVTVEDPIEYRLAGINQVQVHEKTGLTFATALRSILRQDPDVVLVGEIRDRETADIAVRAAMTGHLVLSTMHTNDAVGAVSRLTDLGVDGAALASAIRAVVAQRLLRRLCPACAVPWDPADPKHPSKTAPWHFTDRYLKGMKRPVGCPACRGTGYRGRFAILEVLTIDEESQQLLARSGDRSTLLSIAKRAGMKSLWETGMARVLEGLTDFEELATTVTPPIPESTMSQDAVDSLLGYDRTATPARSHTPHAPVAALPIAAPVPAGMPAVTPTGTPPRASRAVVLHQRDAGAEAPVRALVVHDDATARRALRRPLVSAGFSVVEAADGDAALAYAYRLRPALVVTEFAIPGLDGLSLGQALLGESIVDMVVACTVQGDPDLRAWALEVGFADVFTVQSDLDAVAHSIKLRLALGAAHGAAPASAPT